MEGPLKFWEDEQKYDLTSAQKKYGLDVDIAKKTDKIENQYLPDWIKQQKLPPFLKKVVLVRRQNGKIYPLKELI